MLTISFLVFIDHIKFQGEQNLDVKICSGNNEYHCYLCKECSNFAKPNINSKKTKSSLNT